LLSPPAFNIYLQPERHQLKRAAVIKEEIERLNKELSVTLGAPQNPGCAKEEPGLANCRSVKLNGAIGVSRAVCEHNRLPQLSKPEFRDFELVIADKP
jgi:hypothetical protein